MLLSGFSRRSLSMHVAKLLECCVHGTSDCGFVPNTFVVPCRTTVYKMWLKFYFHQGDFPLGLLQPIREGSFWSQEARVMINHLF